MPSAAAVKASTAAPAESTSPAPTKASTAKGAASDSAAANAKRVASRSRCTGRGVARTVTRTEVTIAATVAIERSLKRTPGRVIAPSERAKEDSVSGEEGIRVKPWIPIPSVATPKLRSPSVDSRVRPRGIDIRFRHVGAAQAGPAIEIVLVTLLVKFARVELSRRGEVECNGRPSPRLRALQFGPSPDRQIRVSALGPHQSRTSQASSVACWPCPD